jgi:CHAT domain-containing protein/tetratricopeptide (TPR) repeat protein
MPHPRSLVVAPSRQEIGPPSLVLEQRLSSILSTGNRCSTVGEVEMALRQRVGIALLAAALLAVGFGGVRLWRSGARPAYGRALTGRLSRGSVLRGSPAAALRKLTDDVGRDPQNARAANDLAVAYLDRAGKKDEPFDLFLALAQANRALALDPRLPEARFNRALALERLSLLHPAHAAWETYLELDPTSDWAEQARRHRAKTAIATGAGWEEQPGRLEELGGDPEVVRAIVAQFPQQARQWVEDKLLGDWANAVQDGKPDRAARKLTLARGLGDVLVQQNKDHLVADAVAAIARTDRDPASRAALVEGHRAYRAARVLYNDQHRTADARPLFERARRSLEQGGSPVAAWASLYLAVAEEEGNEFGQALEVLGRIVRDPKLARYPSLRVRAYWVMGLVDLGAGEPAASLADYQAALPIAEGAGLAEDAAGLHAVLAEDFRFFGQPQKTWRHLLQALAALPRIRTPRRLGAILGETAGACEAAGEWAVARDFRDEEVRVARSAHEPVALSFALLARSRTLDRLGDSAAGERDRGEARQVLEQIHDENLRRRNLVDLLSVESDLLLDRDPARAAVLLDQALAARGGEKNHFALSRLHLAHARAALQSGDEERAEADLADGIQEVEQIRQRVAQEGLQISYFEHSRNLFDTMIGLQAKHRDRASLALDYVERERARALLDRIGSLTAEQQDQVLAVSPQPLSAEALRRELPEGVAVVEYALLDDRLLTWVIRARGIALHDQAARPAEVESQVDRLRAGLEHRTATADPAADSAALFDLLVQPVLPDLTPGERIVFVPDKVLHAVPFAALYDRATERYLAQDRIVGVSPSATFYLEALRRDRQLESRQPPTVLAVGNPLFDREIAPQFSDLKAAADEAGRVASLFPGSQLLIQEKATRPAFLAAAGGHEIVHFGGHAVVNPESPLLSYFLMAPAAEGDSGLFYARSLYGARFARTRLAVLAACSTAAGPVTGEGVLSLARAFLAAGAPTVVASLWEVDDTATARLSRLFYKNLREGKNPATALREAQVALLSSSNPSIRDPGSWAAFEVLGAIAPINAEPKKK